MKMKINEVLEGINKSLEQVRKERGISAKGHFVSVTSVRKSMGPYRQCDVRISYLNGATDQLFDYCSASKMERCTIDNQDKLINATELEALVLLFNSQYTDKWLRIINGEYGTE